MNKTNLIILLSIFSFVLANQFVLYFGISDSPSDTTIIVTNSKTSLADTLVYNDTQKLVLKRNQTKETITPETLFNQNPSFLLYIFFLTFFMAISLGLIFPLIDKTRKNLKSLRKKDVISFSILSFIITICTFGICNLIPNAWNPQQIIEQLGIFLKYPITTMMLLLFPLIVLSSICIFGIFGISLTLKETNFSIENKEDSINSFIRYKKLLDEYMMIFGLFIATGSIIISSVLSDAVNNYFIDNTLINFVPKEFVYIYGLSFTAAIVIVYVPVYMKLRNIGTGLISKMNPIGSRSLEDWNKKNNEYLDIFDLAANAWDGLKTSLMILSPLITSILATII